MAPEPSAPTIVVGTAGHIDHGKTSLLRALTGIDADRLPEERQRGMTIDVGYAHLAFDDGIELDFVDVPGHDRLIGNMLVGAGEIDSVMLVVAADDGPRPQTLEHLQLLDALGIDAGFVVVTKVDMVPPERVDDVVTAVTALLAPTLLRGRPVIAASSITGAGLDGVRAALRAVRDEVASRPGRGPVRLAIDRVFSPKGRGVVVTGTLRGIVARGAWLHRQPGGELARVRMLQVHGAERDLHAGGRVAFNVTGEVAGTLRRGDVLGDATVGATSQLLVELRRPAAFGAPVTWPPRRRRDLRLHAATAQANAAIRLLRDQPGYAIVSLDQPVATFPGDRGVLRDPAQGTVVAGLRVLDLDPPRGIVRRRVTPERLDALREAVDVPDAAAVPAALLALHGARPGKFRSLDLATDVRDSLRAKAAELVDAHHRTAPLSAGLPLSRARPALQRWLRSIATMDRDHADLAAATVDRLIDDLVDEGRLTRRGDALRDPGVAAELSNGIGEAMARLEAALSVPAPPSLEEAARLAGCPPEGARALAAEGRITRLGPDLAWSTPTYHRLAAEALAMARVGPLTPAAFRDATGTSRKFVLAILEDLDRRQVLRRTPDGHVPGPRAPRP